MISQMEHEDDQLIYRPTRSISSSDLEQWHEDLKTNGYAICPNNGCGIMFHRSFDLENHYLDCTGNGVNVTVMCSKCHALLPSSDYISLHNSVLHQIELIPKNTKKKTFSNRNLSEHERQSIQLSQNDKRAGSLINQSSSSLGFSLNQNSRNVPMSSQCFLPYANRPQSLVRQQIIHSPKPDFERMSGTIEGESFQPIQNYHEESIEFGGNNCDSLHSRSTSVSSDPSLVDKFLPTYKPNFSQIGSHIVQSLERDDHNADLNQPRNNLLYKSNISKSKSHLLVKEGQCNDEMLRYTRKEDCENNVYLINTSDFASGNSVSFRQREGQLLSITKQNDKKLLTNIPRQIPLHHKLKVSPPSMNKFKPKNIYNLKRERQTIVQSPYRSGYDTDESDIGEISIAKRFQPSNSILGDDSKSEFGIIREGQYQTLSQDNYLSTPSTSYVQMTDNNSKKLNPIHNIEVRKHIHPEMVYLKKCELAEKVEQLKRVEQAVKLREEAAQESIWLALREQQAALREQQAALNEQQAALKEREQNLLQRELLAHKKIEQVNRILEETKQFKFHKISENVNDLFINMRTSCQEDPLKLISNASSVESLNAHISYDSHHIRPNTSNVILQPGLIFPSHEVQEMPIVDSKQKIGDLSETTLNEHPVKSRRGRKPKKIIYPDGVQEVLPSIKPSNIKRTYSRVPKRNSLPGLSIKNTISNCNSFSKPFFTGNQSIMTEAGKHILKNETGSLTITQLPKSESELYRLSPSANLNCLSSDLKLEIYESPSSSATTIDMHMKWPSRVENSSPQSNCSDVSVSIVEKVEKLSSASSGTNIKECSKNSQDRSISINEYCKNESPSNLVIHSQKDYLPQLNNTISRSTRHIYGQRKSNLTMVTLEGISLPSKMANSPMDLHDNIKCIEVSEKSASTLAECKPVKISNCLLVNKSKDFNINLETEVDNIPCQQNSNEFEILPKVSKEHLKQLTYSLNDSFNLRTTDNTYLVSPIGDFAKGYAVQSCEQDSTVSNKSQVLGDKENLFSSTESKCSFKNDSLFKICNLSNVTKDAHKYALVQPSSDVVESSDHLGICQYTNDVINDHSLNQETASHKELEVNFQYATLSSDPDYSILNRSFESLIHSETSEESPSKSDCTNNIAENHSNNILPGNVSTEAQILPNLPVITGSQYSEVNKLGCSKIQNILFPNVSNLQPISKVLSKPIHYGKSDFNSVAHIENCNTFLVTSSEEPKAILPLEIEVNSEIRNTNTENLNDSSFEVQIPVSIPKPVFKSLTENVEDDDGQVQLIEELPMSVKVKNNTEHFYYDQSSGSNSPCALVDHDNSSISSVEKETVQLMNDSCSSIISDIQEASINNFAAFDNNSLNNLSESIYNDQIATTCLDTETTLSKDGSQSNIGSNQILIQNNEVKNLIVETTPSTKNESLRNNEAASESPSNSFYTYLPKIYKKRGRKKKLVCTEKENDNHLFETNEATLESPSNSFCTYQPKIYKKRGRKKKLVCTEKEKELIDNHLFPTEVAPLESPINKFYTDLPKMYKKRGRKKKLFFVDRENAQAAAPEKILGDFVCGKCNELLHSDHEFKIHVYKEHNGLARIKGEKQNFSLMEALGKITEAYYELKLLSQNSLIYMTCEVCKKTIKSLHGFKYHYENVCRENQLKSVKPIKREAAKQCKSIIKSFASSQNNLNVPTDDPHEFDLKLKTFFSTSLYPVTELIQRFKEQLLDNKTVKCINENCDLHFTDCKKLKIHLKTCSNSKKQYSCSLCEFCTTIKLDIYSHLTRNHSDYVLESDNIASEGDNETDYEVDNYDNDSDFEKPKRKRKKSYPKNYPKICDSDEVKNKVCRKLNSNMIFVPAENMTHEFRQNNYEENLFLNLTCPKSSWVDSLIIEHDKYLPLFEKSSKFKHCNSKSNMSSNDDWIEMNRFGSRKLSSGQIIFAGGPIQSAAWCPIPSDVSEDQFVALACQGNTNLKYPLDKSIKHESLIQIWKCGKLGEFTLSSLSFCIAHDFGLSWCLEWCPSGIFERTSQNDDCYQRLGLLGSSFSDGSIRLFLLPNPFEIKEGNVYKKSPELSLLPYCSEERKVQCTNMSWCSSKGHALIAGSFSNGIVCIWNIEIGLAEGSSILKDYDECGNVILYPINCIKAHHGVCSTVSFCPSTEGRHIVTGGSDRIVRFWDLTQPEQPLTVIRKGIVTHSTWLPHWAGAFIAYDDVFSLGKTCTSFRENGFYGLTYRNILATNASVSNIAASDWLNAIAQVDEAGEVVVSFQHNLTCETQNEKHMFKKRFPLFSIKLKNLKTGKVISLKDDYNSAKQSESPCKTPKSSSLEEIEIRPESLNTYPMTYELATEEFGVLFYDELLDTFPDIASIQEKQYSHLMEPGPITIYPLMGASCVSWNNNFGSHSWIFVGMKSGFGRIINLSFVNQR